MHVNCLCGVHSSGGFDASCVLCLVERLLVVGPSGGGETSSPPFKSSDFFFLTRGFFGGRGSALPPSSSHPRCVHQQCRCVLPRRKDWHLSLPPHTVEEYGGEGTGPSPHNVAVYISLGLQLTGASDGGKPRTPQE